MSSTATDYLNRIDIDYPRKGVDNNSQGFRDNFKNIQYALKALTTETRELQLYTVKTNESSDFYGYTIKNVNLENNSETVYELDLQTGDISIDYSQGSYQVFEVSSGLHTISLSNWPGAGKAGYLKLAITPNDVTYTAIDFGTDNTFSLDTTSTNQTLYTLLPGTNVFEVWSEQSTTNSSPKIYIKQIGRTASTGTANWNTIGTNVIATGTNAETYIYNNNKFGTVALLPNIVTATFISTVVRDGSKTEFAVSSVAGINPGATFFFNNTTTEFTVVSVATTTNYVTTQPEANPNPGSQQISFVNPTFWTGSQPTVLRLTEVKPTSATSYINELSGQVYADQDTVFVIYRSYQKGQVNKVQISGDMSGNPRFLGTATTATTSITTSTSTAVATNEFVWNVVNYAVNTSTTAVAYANTATYAVTATLAAMATTASFATTASTMISGTNGYGVRQVAFTAPASIPGYTAKDGDIWYQII